MNWLTTLWTQSTLRHSNPFYELLAKVYDTPTVVDIPFIEWVRELFLKHGIELPNPEDVDTLLQYLKANGVLEINLNDKLAVITGIYNYGR